MNVRKKNDLRIERDWNFNCIDEYLNRRWHDRNCFASYSEFNTEKSVAFNMEKSVAFNTEKSVVPIFFSVKTNVVPSWNGSMQEFKHQINTYL